MTDPIQPPSKQRLRLTFAKKSQVKYISHLDLVLVWERALRRAQIPLAYSQGFNPRPKIQVASGLPLGTTGLAEILDIVVTEPIAPNEALARIRATVPNGISLRAVEEVPLKAPSLQPLLRQAEYRVIVETDLTAEEILARSKALLAANKIMQTRRRKNQDEEFDLRPWLHELRLESVAGGQAQLHLRLTAGQAGNLRPEDVLKAMGLDDSWSEIERTRLIFEGDDTISE